MKKNLPKNNLKRKSIRLPDYDYSEPGAYFVTICTYKFNFLLCEIKNCAVILNQFGKIARAEWFRSSELRSYINLYDDEFVIMPNHIHGIIWITDVGATGSVARVDKQGPTPKSLGAIIGQFKSRTSKLINQLRDTPAGSVWQRNYYDRIIRNEKELNDIRNYIQNNPFLWEENQINKKGSSP